MVWLEPKWSRGGEVLSISLILMSLSLLCSINQGHPSSSSELHNRSGATFMKSKSHEKVMCFSQLNDQLHFSSGFFLLTVRLMETPSAQGRGCHEDECTAEDGSWKTYRKAMRGCNYPEGKVKTFGRLFVISFISASRTNRSVFCEIMLERLPRPF